MQQKVNNARREVEKGNYSNALVHLYLIYSKLYKIKNKIKAHHSSKNFKAIANSKCEFYIKWKINFLDLDNKGSGLIKTIEINSYKIEKDYVNVTGDDMLKRTIVMRRHCKMFADIEIIKKKEEFI